MPRCLELVPLFAKSSARAALTVRQGRGSRIGGGNIPPQYFEFKPDGGVGALEGVTIETNGTGHSHHFMGVAKLTGRHLRENGQTCRKRRGLAPAGENGEGGSEAEAERDLVTEIEVATATARSTRQRRRRKRRPAKEAYSAASAEAEA